MSTSGCVLLYPCLFFLASLLLYFEIGSVWNYIRLPPGALTGCKWIDWHLRLTEVVIENRAIYEPNLDINVSIYIVLTINLGAKGEGGAGSTFFTAGIALAFSSFMYWFFHWPVLGLASKSKPPPSLNEMKHLDWLRTGKTTRCTVI